MDKIDRQFINWAFEFGIVVAIFCLIGNTIDEKFNTSPNALFLGFIIALAVEGWNLYKILRSGTKNKPSFYEKEKKV